MIHVLCTNEKKDIGKIEKILKKTSKISVGGLMAIFFLIAFILVIIKLNQFFSQVRKGLITC